MKQMKSDYEAKIKPLDELFELFYLFSPIVSGMLVVLGVDSRLLILPLVMFLLWTLYIYAYRAKYQLQDEKELSLIERARGITYFFGLVASLAGVSCLFYFPGLANHLITVVLILVCLILIEHTVPWAFFSKQIALFTKDQRKKFTEVLYFADSVSYYFSGIVVFVDLALLNFIPWTVFIFLACIVLTILSYRQERKSRRLARNLAISLRGTKWLKKYQGKKTPSAYS